MANSRRRLMSMLLMLALCVALLGVWAACAYADTWWSEWNWEGNTANRAGSRLRCRRGERGNTDV